MPSPRYDPEIRLALRELNRIPGVRTRSSCQGKSRPDEQSTHADLAYVVFRSPIPLAFEEHLLATIGDLARIDSLSVYSRWPERNAEFCIRLGEAARTFLEARCRESWVESPLPSSQLLESVEALLDSSSPVVLSWCFDCRRASVDPREGPGRHGPGCRPSVLLEGGLERRLALLDQFLSADEHPPDPTLRSRIGDVAMLERVERGDFGTTFRRSWRAFRTRCAREVLHEEIRTAVAEERARGAAVDYYFRPGKVIFARRKAP